MSANIIRTVLGDIALDQLRLILPHEHLFTDLRGPGIPDYAKADPDFVVMTMLPYLKAAQEAGVTGLVECSTIGVGRNIDILRKLAQSSGIHLVAPTGIYKEAYTPDIYKDQPVDEMADLWIVELTKGIGRSPSKAGFIKIAISDDGPQPIEIRNIRAAARASNATGAAVASHTIGGKAALDELNILASESLNLEKFIWVHANSESDRAYHLEVASLGAYVEFDCIGQPNVNLDVLVADLLTMLEKGQGDKILLSHDAGFFQPGNTGGVPEGGIRDFTSLTNQFIPLLKEKGVDTETIELLTVQNPKRAFAIQKES